MLGKTYEQVYCAFCKTPRKLFRKTHVTVVNFIETLVLSLTLMWIIWGTLDFRFVVFWFISLMFSEIFIMFRHRMSVKCKYCGFDPILYKRSPAAAADIVKSTIERRKDDPAALLSSHARLDIPYRTKDGQVVRPFAKDMDFGPSEDSDDRAEL